MKFDNEEIDSYLERHNYYFHLSFDEQVRLLLKYHSNKSNCQEVFQRKLMQYMDMVNEYVYISKTDAVGRITGASDAFLERIGYDISEILGQTHAVIRHPDVPDEVYDELWGTIVAGKTWSGELKNLTKNHEVFWAEMTISPEFDFENKIIGYVAIRKDITDKKIIEEIAIRDELTGLHNRRFYREVIHNELYRMRREHGKMVFMMMDVDHFKRYNDTYGHQEGDNVLKKVADTLRSVIKRGGDHVFRMGGEEFAVLLPDTEEKDGFKMAENIRQRIESLHIEHRMNDSSPYVTISIGLTTASARRDLVDEESLYKTADDALYLAKKAGRNCTIIHSSGELELF